MPRRNRNASTTPIDRDELAAEAGELATQLVTVIAHRLFCAACRVNPATEGDYCLPCKGHIILSARNNTVKRR